jgi:predicted dehydrogenase
MKPLKVGIVGTGNVLAQYLDKAKLHQEFEVVAVADIKLEAAEAAAAQYGIEKALLPEALLDDPSVEIVVFTEKPFATDLEDARKIIDAATQAKRYVGCAPASFLGGGMQTSRKLIDDGWIGRPVAAVATFTCRGYESWHPNIDPFYSPGAGPMLDIGPYLVSNLINFFGAATRVSASAQRSSATRTRPAGGENIKVDVPTHIAGTIDFESGAVATVITSWDIWNASLPFIEIYGTSGTLDTPHPDLYTGEPQLRRGDDRDLSDNWYPPHGGDWRNVPMTHRGDAGRAIGLAEFADAIRAGRKSRVDMEVAYHGLEIMLAFEESSKLGRHIDIVSRCERPSAMPAVGPDQPYRFD